MNVRAPRTSDGDRFRLSAGRPSLDFCSTLRRRHTDPIEQLTSSARLSAWIVEVGLIPALVTEPQVNEAILLREAAYRLFSAHLAQRPADLADLDRINAAAAGPTPVPQLDRLGQVGWVTSDPFTADMAQLARDAIDILTGPYSHRLRECAGRDCAVLFVDTSRAGQRRWCAMNRCGNREHQRDHRARQPSDR